MSTKHSAAERRTEVFREMAEALSARLDDKLQKLWRSEFLEETAFEVSKQGGWRKGWLLRGTDREMSGTFNRHSLDILMGQFGVTVQTVSWLTSESRITVKVVSTEEVGFGDVVFAGFTGVTLSDAERHLELQLLIAVLRALHNLGQNTLQRRQG